MKKRSVLDQATGRIPVTLTNDMLFHFVMQKSNVALKGLVCALKGLNPEDVRSVVLTNPIDYNEAGKEVILDVKVTMNDAEILNIELQMYCDSDWIKRSLLYLCRAFDSIGKGDRIEDIMPATHIGILAKDLFPEYPEFYARYLMTNIRTHQIYTPIFGINVLSLNQTAIATEEDKASGLVYWAKLFLAETWEEVKSLAKNREAFMAVAETMYDANADIKQRSLFEARMKYKEVMASKDYRIEKLETELAQSRQEIGDLSFENNAFQQEIEALHHELEALRTQLANTK